MPVPMKRRCTSLRRLACLLMKYSPDPSRLTRRVTVTSWYSVPSSASQSAKVMDTSQKPRGLRVSVPLNTTSTSLVHRRAVGRCSPSTQRIASDTFDLPHPLGPTIAIMPGSNVSRVLSAKLLKPMMSSCLRYIEAYTRPRLMRCSAISTAFSAAPRRSWSPDTNMSRPFLSLREMS